MEIKSVEALAPVHKKQLLTYLRLADKRLGLLINFNVALIKDGIARVVNGLEENLTPSRQDAKKTSEVQIQTRRLASRPRNSLALPLSGISFTV